MGDLARSFFNVQESTGKPKKTYKYKEKRPEGIKREVFELQQNNKSFKDNVDIPVLQNEQPKNIYKEKRSCIEKVSKWTFGNFTNSARSDNIQLRHWEKVSENEKKNDYKYAKFNKQIKIYVYNEEEYKYFIDPIWTKEETDYLFDLCKQFDLRFIVIYDRFLLQFPATQKCLEDLKERYYTITRKLMEEEIKVTKNANLAETPLFKFKYDKSYELKRKEQSNKLFFRTNEEVEEEKKLINEYMKLESLSNKKITTPRKKIKQVPTEMSSLQPPRKKRRKGSLTDSQDPTLSSPSLPSIRTPRRDRLSGVSVRSSRMQNVLPISQKMMKKLDLALDELKISQRPMPTSAVCKEYNELRLEIVHMLELQNKVKKREYELQMLRAKLKLSNEQQT